MYEVIGIQINKGVSKKTQKEYHFCTIHCIDHRKYDNCEGKAVKSFDFNMAFQQDFVIPNVGDTIEVSYNYKGYPSRCFIV